jgi:hypothetical protein
VAQLAGAVGQPLGLWWLAVAAPHPRVPITEMAAQAVGALQPAGIAARDHAARAEQHGVAWLSEVDVDLEL